MHSDHSPQLPDKLYFRIGEVSRITELAAHVLRFWESEFPKLRPKRTTSGQRLYRKKDVEMILKIRHLLHEKKFTIAGAREYLNSGAGKEPAAAPEVDLEEIRTELQRIRRILED
ncbi:MAG TPA: MerR family transcriptional regulator [Desulfobacterales bacterium]